MRIGGELLRPHVGGASRPAARDEVIIYSTRLRAQRPILINMLSHWRLPTMKNIRVSRRGQPRGVNDDDVY